MRFVFAALAILWLAGSSFEAVADDPYVYRWTDSNGSVHISNSIKSVPGRYFQRVKKIKRINVNSSSKKGDPIFSTASGEARINFDPNDIGVIAPAIFNGSVKRDVVIDTGSELVTITTKLAKALGYDYENARKTWFRTQSGPVFAPVIRIKRLSIGEAHVTGLEAAVIDFEGRGSVSALAGMNFLSAFIIEIDMQKRSLTLTSPAN